MADALRPRALLAAHVVALLRGKLRASPDGSKTRIRVRAADEAWDITNVHLIGTEIVIEAHLRRVP